MSVAEQQSLPLGFVRGEAVVDKPEDLYIPPDALELILESFSGPMDLLLYLIKRQKLDIVDLPILNITRQYVEYVEMMKELKLELASDYLVMAAILAEIKSRMLLPKPPQQDDEDEEDPRAALIRRLQEYEAIRKGAEWIEQQPQTARDTFIAEVESNAQQHIEVTPPAVELAELALAFSRVLQQLDLKAHHHIQREQLSTRERMSQILQRVSEQTHIRFSALFSAEEGRAGAVVSFLAILELVKEALIEVVQVNPDSEIHIRQRGAEAR